MVGVLLNRVAAALLLFASAAVVVAGAGLAASLSGAALALSSLHLVVARLTGRAITAREMEACIAMQVLGFLAYVFFWLDSSLVVEILGAVAAFVGGLGGLLD